MKDWRGTDIVEGSVIIYPVRTGSFMYVNEARVGAVVESDNPRYSYLLVKKINDSSGWTEKGQALRLTALKRVTVIDYKPSFVCCEDCG